MASITDQNWVVWNQGKNPLVNFNFMLRVELLFDLPCRKVRAFERELEYDYIQEGGLNDYVHMRRKGITKPFTLEVERYVGVDYLDPLPLGADLVLPLMLFVARNHDQFIPGVVARTYVFTGCTVMKKTYGDLVADQSGLLVETTTIGYREMLCVDIPWSEVGDNIPKSIHSNSASPTDAKTQEKSYLDYKLLAQQLCTQAEEAKQLCDSEYSAEDADALLKELEAALKKLDPISGADGTLEKAYASAKAGLKNEDGQLKTAAYDALRLKTRADKADLEKKIAARDQAVQALEAAQSVTADLLQKQETLKRLKDLSSEESEATVQAIAAELGLLPPTQTPENGAPPEAKNAPPSEEEYDTLSEEKTEPISDTSTAAPSETENDALSEEERKALRLKNLYNESILKLLDKIAAAKEAESPLVEPAAKAVAAAEAAQTTFENTKAAAEEAEQAANDARLALDEAETALKRGKEQYNRLQNSKTNLSLRKDRAVQAQKTCAEQCKQCQEENSTVQALDDGPEIYTGYETVSKLSKNTCYYERQVRETCQYMQSARKLLDDLKSLLETLPEPQAAT